MSPSRFVAPLAPAACIAAVSLALVSNPVLGQPADDFVPVTDAMLQDPEPADWPMWRRTLDGWGYSPLDQVTRDNVGGLRLAWSRAPDGGHAGGDAAGLRRHPLHAERQRRHSGHRRGERRPRLGVPPRPAGGRLRVRRRQCPQHAEHRHLRPVHHQRQRRRLRLRARCGDRRDRMGDADLRLPGDTGRAQLRPDHRRRPGDFRAELPAARRAGVVRRRGARRAHRRGAVAAADGAGAGRAGRRDLGAACPTRSGCTSAPGCRPATTPSCG